MIPSEASPSKVLSVKMTALNYLQVGAGAGMVGVLLARVGASKVRTSLSYHSSAYKKLESCFISFLRHAFFVYKHKMAESYNRVQILSRCIMLFIIYVVFYRLLRSSEYGFCAIVRFY